jgi:5-methylcytosine-specific restriction endonuclease McrA
MIRRERSSVEPPRPFLRRAAEALDRLRAFYRLSKRERSQRRAQHDPELLVDRSLLSALAKLFERKCAYCESPLGGVSPVDTDRFRPAQEAMDLNGRVRDPDLYWWLAYEWENLYPACSACTRAKATRFPVRGARARAEARGPALEKEHRLLLDPCADEPEEELRFERDGTVTGTTERGAVSTEVFALNRPDLVEARRAVAERLLRQLVLETPEQAASERDRLAPSNEPYTALRRQLVDEHAGVVEARPKAFHRRVDRGSVWLERVDLENFRAIRRVTLDFPEPGPNVDREPWLMLLGVNGVGKSTVLQAIGLSFMSAARRKRYFPDAGKQVTNSSPSPEGSITLTFSDGKQAGLRFRRGDPNFRGVGRPPPMNVYAFGSTRLPPAPGQRSDDRPHDVRLENLFDPRYPLSLGEQWLASPKQVSARQFEFLASSLRHLLELEDDQQLVRSRGVLSISRDGETLLMSDHSDGYRSVVAFAADLMLNLSARWDSMQAAEGLVLVDELEVHLHPTWRMTVVDRLRQVFPRLRFAITTHDPLSLRGAERGEVHVLRRDDETHEVVVTQRDIPPGLTADGLLTGSWFGMATTLDDGTIGLLQEHSRLLLEKRTSEVSRRREEIEEELRRRRGVFAENDDERLVRSVVAELRADRPSLTAEERDEAREAVLEKARVRLSKRSIR